MLQDANAQALRHLRPRRVTSLFQAPAIFRAGGWQNSAWLSSQAAAEEDAPDGALMFLGLTPCSSAPGY